MSDIARKLKQKNSENNEYIYILTILEKLDASKTIARR
jgi:hypothetical protein